MFLIFYVQLTVWRAYEHTLKDIFFSCLSWNIEHFSESFFASVNNNGVYIMQGRQANNAVIFMT